ncbi:hypothetical protein MAHJHV58_04000 [Mycobacterium avium subsp. hominissuis]
MRRWQREIDKHDHNAVHYVFVQRDATASTVNRSRKSRPRCAFHHRKCAECSRGLHSPFELLGTERAPPPPLRGPIGLVAERLAAAGTVPAVMG